MRRRASLVSRIIKNKIAGFLCGFGLFIGAFALAAGDVVIERWGIENVLIPMVLVVVAALGWYLKSVDQKLSTLNRGQNDIAQRISHIEGKLGISTRSREG